VALISHCPLCNIKHIATVSSFHLILKLQQNQKDKQTVTYPLFSNAFFAYGDDLIRDIQVVFAPERAVKVIEDYEIHFGSEFR
jgi:hypothetical protein